MMVEGIKLLTAAQMQQMDSLTINEVGIPGIVLMENAGRATVDTMEDFFEMEESFRVAIFCGKGNNGGDGFVIARHLESRGHEVVIYLLCKIEHLTGDALVNAQVADNMGLEIVEIDNEQKLEAIPFEPEDFDLAVDAIFGTGLTSAVRGLAEPVIEMINEAGLPVVAVDIPSGLSADTGEILGATVDADLTVTFAYAKLCHVLSPAAEVCGVVEIADICIPEYLETDDQLNHFVDAESIDPLWFERQNDSHKGTYGHLMVVAGSLGKAGAVSLAGASALATGTGLVTLGVAREICNAVDSMVMETMTQPLPDENGYISQKALQPILDSLADKSAFVCGPGMGTEETTVELIKSLVKEVTVPMLLDADAINAFTGAANQLTSKNAPIVITPHPGEMARLMGLTAREVQSKRIEVARNLAQKNGIIVVLKGHRTITALPDGKVYVNLSGNAGMATAGSGDVLTGMIAGLMAQSAFSVEEAVLAGVYLHGLAGDVAAQELGQVSLTASDILASIPEALNLLVDVEDE